MEKTGFTYALIGVFLMFVAFSADARPQNDLVEVDGFVFDGPVERSNKFPNNNRRTFPDFPPPNPNPEITGTTTTTPSPDMTRCLQNCPVTAQYNPVCGSDNVVYSNIGKLECANSCGSAVTFRYYGQCISNVRGK